MAKIIDDETIENVCILAKLSLSDEAKEKAKEDMQKMLDYVEKLDELDTDGVEPVSYTHLDVYKRQGNARIYGTSWCSYCG